MEEEKRVIALDCKLRQVGEPTAHTSETSAGRRQLGDEAMAVADRAGFPIATVDGRIKYLERCCRILLIHFSFDAGRPLATIAVGLATYT